MPYIPLDTLKTVLKDPSNKTCYVCGISPVQIHHAINFAGKSIDNNWSLVGLCQHHHDMVTPHKPKYNKEIEERVMFYVLSRATDEELRSISKVVNYILLRDKLKQKYVNER